MTDMPGRHTIAFHSLGCKVNRYETDAVAMRFREAGFEEVPFDGPADVYLVNTCTVTGEADRKTRQVLRRARAANPGAVVAAMGCHVAAVGREGLADVVVGCSDRVRIVERVVEALSGRRPGESVPPDPGDTPESFEETGPVTLQSETRAYIKIQDGCDDFCAYCAIPYARGRSRSRDAGRVIEEARALAEAGFAEVVLTGIHIGAYGADRGEDAAALARLARAIGDIPGIGRIRLGSLEPQSLTPGFIRELREVRGLCPHFHLSLQSGSGGVLKRMGRRYGPEDFEDMVRSIRTVFPGAGITTDVMAGFPGETEEEHAESVSFCRRIGFSRMHVFRFSRRPGTRAAEMDAQVPAGVAARRAAELARLTESLLDDFARGLDRAVREVLVEGVDDSGAGSGYTPEYAAVELTGLSRGDTGRILPVLLDYAGAGRLRGRPAN